MRNDEDICERCWVWNVSKECSTLPRLIQELFWPKLSMIFLAQTGHGEWWEFLGVKCFQSFVIEAEFSTLPCLIQEPNFLNKTEHDNFFCSNWTWQMMRTDGMFNLAMPHSRTFFGQNSTWIFLAQTKHGEWWGQMWEMWEMLPRLIEAEFLFASFKGSTEFTIPEEIL